MEHGTFQRKYNKVSSVFPQPLGLRYVYVACQLAHSLSFAVFSYVSQGPGHLLTRDQENLQINPRKDQREMAFPAKTK